MSCEIDLSEDLPSCDHSVHGLGNIAMTEVYSNHGVVSRTKISLLHPFLIGCERKTTLFGVPKKQTKQYLVDHQ